MAGSAGLASIVRRPATRDDLAACAAIWRTSINDYAGRLNQPEIPDDLGPILRLYDHLWSVDPDGFVVAEDQGAAGAAGEPRIVGFVAAIRRKPLWFLSMLFVLPDAQGSGVGRALLAAVMPAAGSMALGTCTDTAQPISNALYASLGIVPRMPLVRLVGLPDRLAALPSLPVGVRAVRFNDLAAGAPSDGGPVRRGVLAAGALDDELADIDALVAGFEHRVDHAFVRAEGRTGFLFLDGSGSPIGYGYASEAGRVGPVAVLDAALLAPAVAHLVTTIEPRGAFGIWLPGAAGETTTALLRAGFRLDGFPCLVCWDRPVTDFSRYVPISPGLL